MWALTNICQSSTQPQLINIFLVTTVQDDANNHYQPANVNQTNLVMKAFVNGLKSFNDKSLISNILKSIKILLETNNIMDITLSNE